MKWKRSRKMLTPSGDVTTAAATEKVTSQTQKSNNNNNIDTSKSGKGTKH